MIQIVIRILLTPFALIADICYGFNWCVLAVLLGQERYMKQPCLDIDLPNLQCLWRRPWFKNNLN